MAKPSESEIQNEMRRIGGTGGDFFSAQNRLQQKLDEAEAALEKLKPVVTETDAAPWRIEPSELEITYEMSRGAGSREDARASAAKRLAADARRLASFSAVAATEISEALEQAEAAREKAANLLAEHEAALSAVTTGIFALGNVRRKIAAVKALTLDATAEKQLATTALNFWVDKKTTSETPQNASGFRAYAEDLTWRRALNGHIAEYVAPLEKQATALIAAVRAQAESAKMDLRKVFALLASERGQSGGDQLFHDSTFYEGLI